MKPDGSLFPTTRKSTLIHELEGVISGTDNSEESIEMPITPHQSAHVLTSILIDGMAVVQEMIVRKDDIKCYRDLSQYFIQRIDNISRDYCETYLLFDNHTVTDSMKDRIRQLWKVGRTQDKGCEIENSTPIKNFKVFLGTIETEGTLHKKLSSCANCQSLATRTKVLCLPNRKWWTSQVHRRKPTRYWSCMQ